jgi:hypothetical protein
VMVETLLKFEDDTLYVKTTQDVEDIIENNKRLQNEQQKSDWGRHVASIPNNFINAWLNEAWAAGNVNMKMFDEDFNRMVKMKLDDPDWRWLRTDNNALSFKTGWRG